MKKKPAPKPRRPKKPVRDMNVEAKRTMDALIAKTEVTDQPASTHRLKRRPKSQP